jgi:heme/copper-type cytochrome/quinol oxidase subunit 4
VIGDLIATGVASSRVFLPVSFLVDFLHYVLQMTQWLYLISDDTSERWLISSKIQPIIMLLVVVNDQNESWLVTP